MITNDNAAWFFTMPLASAPHAAASVAFARSQG